ncbi:hypothetical protein HYW21_08390 [Candidatus Woesearchaeota archaeon]|nr:hypothetical protein [Candidatus Woesearchaeota archaeon]
MPQRLIMTEGIEALCDALHTVQPRWETAERVLGRQRKPRSLNLYVDLVAQAHLNAMVRGAQAPLALRGYTLVDPFAHNGYQGNEVHYSASDHAYVVRSGSERKPTTNRVVLIDNVPVGLDIKIARWSTTVARGKDHERRNSVKNILRPEVYQLRLANMYDLFHADEIGYIVVVPYDTWLKRQHSSPGSVYGDFLASQGCIVPFYADRHRFRTEVETMVKDLGLPLKRPGTN